MGEASSIQIGCTHIGSARHVCAFFHDDEEASRVLLPFVAEGFAAGDKAIHILRPERQAAHLRALAEIGVDVPTAQASGQLDLRSNIETYLSGGGFDPDRMLAAFEGIAGDEHGFGLNRIICEMDWTVERPSLFEDVIRFEARVNDLWSRHADLVVCFYDVTKVTGDAVIDIMRTHPHVLIGNVLHENPFFLPPHQFLRERLGRTNVPTTT